MKALIPMVSLAMILGWFSPGVRSATRYVEDAWGTDAGPNDCRDRRAPCATIDYALDQAQPNDRIIVGPGAYEPATNLDFDGKQGIKLTSLAGASATTIDATGLSNFYVILISGAHKGVLGQRRRGFTILADDSVSNSMVRINLSDGVRIEGNRLISPATTLASAIRITDSDKLTIRYNDISAIGGGSLSHGIETTTPGADSNRKWNISENRLVNIGECMLIDSSAPNNTNKVTKNLLEDCQVAGIRVRNYDSMNNPVVSSRDRYMDNIVRLANVASYRRAMEFEGGNPRIQRNLVDGGRGYVHGMVLDGTTNARVKDNLLQGPVGNPSASGLNSYGLSVIGGANSSASVTGNTLQGFYRVVYATHLQQIKTFTNNNVMNTSSCGFFVDNNTTPPRPLRARGNYWDGGSDPDLGSCGNTQMEVNEGDLSFSPSSRPKPIKFKDPFN